MSKQTRTSERKSTIENSQELESRLRKREIKAQEKRSKKLANVREEELENFVKESLGKNALQDPFMVQIDQLSQIDMQTSDKLGLC